MNMDCPGFGLGDRCEWELVKKYVDFMPTNASALGTLKVSAQLNLRV
jgi:hypothetical protein